MEVETWEELPIEKFLLLEESVVAMMAFFWSFSIGILLLLYFEKRLESHLLEFTCTLAYLEQRILPRKAALWLLPHRDIDMA